MLSTLFILSGVTGIIVTLWLIVYVVVADASKTNPILTNAIIIWAIGACGTELIAYAFVALDLLKAWRNTSTLTKLVLVSVTVIGGGLGLAAWLWLKANP